ncbi:hypothetical protein [Saccharopolyspora hattusasensis]|uniref:hypothetical protein n=1 Tax=Saccharopolyspora hattusasensis TaxID=1128679 RepID=UPI003D99CB69
MAFTPLPGARGWFELYNRLPDDYTPPSEGLSPVLVDEFDIEIGVTSHKIEGIGARINSREWVWGSLPHGVPRGGQTVAVSLGLDYEPELAVGVEYESKFPVRLAADDGLYAGPAEHEEVTRWVYGSCGFWLGADDSGSLKALYFPVQASGMSERETASKRTSWLKRLGLH